jgi:large repetitive protein
MRRILVLLATMAAAVLVASGVAVAAVVSFSNTSTILIPSSGTDGTANPYPSEITVSGFSGTIRDVNLTLKGFRHTYPDDVGVLLVGPTGQSALVMSDSGSEFGVVGLRLVLDDEATNSLPDNNEDGVITDGPYKPTQGTDQRTDGEFEGNLVPHPFPQEGTTPPPTGDYGTTLSVFDGTDPNGTWKLYVVDDTGFDKGRLARGWKLRIKAEVL